MLCARSCTPTCTCSLFIWFSFGFGLAGRGRAGRAAAAVLGQEADQLVHVIEVGAIDDESPVLATFRDAGSREPGEMERKRRRRKIERFADAARSQAGWARLHEKAKDREPGSLRERAEGLYGLRRFHISRIVETLDKSKRPMQQLPCAPCRRGI